MGGVCRAAESAQRQQRGTATAAAAGRLAYTRRRRRHTRAQPPPPGSTCPLSHRSSSSSLPHTAAPCAAAGHPAMMGQGRGALSTVRLSLEAAAGVATGRRRRRSPRPATAACGQCAARLRTSCLLQPPRPLRRTLAWTRLQQGRAARRQAAAADGAWLSLSSRPSPANQANRAPVDRRCIPHVVGIVARRPLPHAPSGRPGRGPPLAAAVHQIAPGSNAAPGIA